MKILQWKKKILPLRNDDFGASSFVTGLTRSSVFVPLLSIGSTEPFTRLSVIEVRLF